MKSFCGIESIRVELTNVILREAHPVILPTTCFSSGAYIVPTSPNDSYKKFEDRKTPMLYTNRHIFVYRDRFNFAVVTIPI